jgi:hypothetical protein
MQQALMMSQKSGFTSIGQWNILQLFASIKKVYYAILHAVAYPGIFFGGVQQIQLRTEGKEIWGAVAP